MVTDPKTKPRVFVGLPPIWAYCKVCKAYTHQEPTAVSAYTCRECETELPIYPRKDVK